MLVVGLVVGLAPEILGEAAQGQRSGHIRWWQKNTQEEGKK